MEAVFLALWDHPPSLEVVFVATPRPGKCTLGAGGTGSAPQKRHRLLYYCRTLRLDYLARTGSHDAKKCGPFSRASSPFSAPAGGVVGTMEGGGEGGN